MNTENITEAARIVRAAQQIVALTGAGFSTPSGIPDFRGDGGLWLQEDPMAVASLSGFRNNPQRFFRWFQPLLDTLLSAQPNPAHLALNDLEHAGKMRAVITQNIDGLHQRAGSREVYELHGHVRSATCIVCHRQIPSDALLKHARRGEAMRCSCGGMFKPNVVLFEEELPQGLYWLAMHALEQCDVVLVAGTALEVFPVSSLPLIALERGARLVIVNKSSTHLDERADVVLRGDVAEILPAITATMADNQ
ncbi:MAG: NAD-dependent deacylase [Chloroflexi bacterium AL-W]|nr:NAD-dependent deacylase [Chloroflexi bacterium AL-N1]NOK64874.1 NAD-dependent deacylase [Chloroflexi bacterium AL-N10]NOK76644.1 NAD-dependent deacylase [Chloroflexi bacterium AL-N5]NOK80127.1 NAD-dependent deacylase [Chloroflexi bacterium AL-W]NOK86640.1 NAD-dependent deacylase [Chloroflexi bacterium AL-N15]